MRFKILWILSLSTACIAQKSITPAPEPNGTVTGRVFCGDTGRPARFASVSLRPVNSQNEKNQAPGTTTSVAVDTTLDGSYILTHVAPGSYYVIVKMNDYINPLAMFSPQQLEHPTDQLRTLINQAIPRVNIEQDATAHTDVQLQRGAAVSGTVTYDDGSPAEGITVNLLHKDENGKWVPLNNPGYFPSTFTTDDRGYYRLSAQLPDTYLLEENLNLNSNKSITTRTKDHGTNEMMIRTSRFSLSFYGDGTPEMGQAQSFTFRGNDERTGQDVTIPIGKLHRFTGRVAAGPSGHLVNAARVELISTTDTSKKKSLAHADIDRDDGLFHFEYVPEGTYTLRVTNARDVTWEPAESPTAYNFHPDKEHVLETYGNAEIPVMLEGDLSGIVVTVPLKKEGSSKQDNPVSSN